MLWPLAQQRHVANPQLTQRLAELRAQNPESERWLTLVEAAFAELTTRDSEPWANAVVTLALPAERPVGTPLLHGSEISVSRRALRRWVGRLFELATDHVGSERAGDLDETALLESGLCQDEERLEMLAQTLAMDGAALRVLAQMAVLPLLQSCGRVLGPELPAAWWEGYCPMCGAWPTLGEFRGLERKRWLRCGRCASGWETSWLRCPYCGETHHGNLGYLAAEEKGGETTRKVEVCKSCHGYVKGEPTVQPLAGWEILLDDIATVPLELAALDRGYHRPERPGFALRARIVET